MAELSVDADLRLQVTTSAGRSTTARITGAGQQVRVDVDNPDVLLAAVHPADVGRVADLLAASGITVRVLGPNGLAATIGAGASSRIGKVFTGSSAVAASYGATARTVLTTPTTWAVASAVVLTAIAVVRGLQRR